MIQQHGSRIEYFALGITLLTALSASAQEAKLVPAAGSEWTNVFAETRASAIYKVQAPDGFRGRVEWTLADVGTNRVLPRGRGEIAVAAGDKTVTIPLEFPPLREGVTLKARLAVALIDDAAKETSAEHAKTIWIFSDDPFAGRRQALEDLKIVLYDPDVKLATAEAFKALKIPFEQANNSAELGDYKDRVVIIGESVSFEDEPELPRTLLTLARHGATVICLAPANGTLPLPGTETQDEDVQLLRRTALSKLDSRLDASAWVNCPGPVRSSLAIKSVDGNVVAEVVKGSGGFPWLQVDYPEAHGRLVICGFGFIECWQRTPTPRYALDALLRPRKE